MQSTESSTQNADAFKYLRLPRRLCLKGALNPVFRVLCDHANYRSGWAKLHYSTIAAEAGVHRTTAIKCVQRLEARGLVEVLASTKAQTNEQGANFYRVIAG